MNETRDLVDGWLRKAERPLMDQEPIISLVHRFEGCILIVIFT
jgi:hypothetical protein